MTNYEFGDIVLGPVDEFKASAYDYLFDQRREGHADVRSHAPHGSRLG
jgi:hypothetical protein